MESVVLQDIYVNLFMAMALGMVLGIERFVAHKTAGMRTYTLVSLGSAVFVTISNLITIQLDTAYDYHLLAQVVAAAGFLGVGAIVHRSDNQVSGITTASGLWVAAGIGMACGFGLYKLAIIVTILALFTFVVLWFIEAQIRKIPLGHKEDNPL